MRSPSPEGAAAPAREEEEVGSALLAPDEATARRAAFSGAMNEPAIENVLGCDSVRQRWIPA